MFRVEIKDIDGLYNAMKEVDKFDLDSRETSIDGLRHFYSRLESEKKSYSLETLICADRKEDCFVPYKRMVELLKDKYDVKAESEAQLVLSKDGREYHVIKKGSTNLNVYIKSPKSSKTQFEKILKDYAEILAAFFNAYTSEKGKEVNEIHTIGNRIVRIQSSEKEKASRGSLFGSLFGDDLDGFEKKIEIEDPEVSFDQIGGCRQGKIEMMRIYRDIVNPEQARFFGRDPDKSKGYILVGESGNGKTFLVKALATKLKEELDGKVKFYAVNYEDITSIYRGGEAQATGKIFDLVEKNEKEGLKTLLFLDELHLVGSRSNLGPKDEALDTLLAHLDGMKKYKGLTVIGATYFPVEGLDSALKRPGRLSKQITIENPTEEERVEIFDIYIKQGQEIAKTEGNENSFGEIDIQKIAEATDNFNGSHIAGVVAAVIDWKEDETIKKAKKESIEVRDAFTPITTEEFLEVIKSYEKVERPKKIGFNRK